MSQKILIRKAVEEDVPSIHTLIRELAIFERAEEEHQVSAEELREHGFGSKPSFQAIVAELNNEVVGIAVYFSYYSTWKGNCIYLEDLIVTNQHRSKGIGKLLLDELIRLAKLEKVHSVRWQVLDWNVDALRFYQELGARSDGSWVNCRLDV